MVNIENAAVILRGFPATLADFVTLPDFGRARLPKGAMQFLAPFTHVIAAIVAVIFAPFRFSVSSSRFPFII